MKNFGLFFLLIVSLFFFCVAPVKQFYPDSFYHEDSIYQNKSLRFSLKFRGYWQIKTDPAEMSGSTRNFARSLRNSGAELLFVGTTIDGLQGVRGIAINYNTPEREYAESIRSLNKADVKKDMGLTDIIVKNIPMVQWDYFVGNFRFVEFYFMVGTCDIRIAFWSKPDVFERFFPVYLEILSSISLIGHF